MLRKAKEGVRTPLDERLQFGTGDTLHFHLILIGLQQTMSPISYSDLKNWAGWASGRIKADIRLRT